MNIFHISLDSTLSDQDGMKAIHWSIVSSNTQALKVYIRLLMYMFLNDLLMYYCVSLVHVHVFPNCLLMGHMSWLHVSFCFVPSHSASSLYRVCWLP